MPFMNNIYLLPDLLGDGCWVLGVDDLWVGQKLQYYIGLIRLIGLDKANSPQRLIRLIWLMLFIKADVPDMAIGIYLSKSK